MPPEYVEAMHLILQQEHPDDFVLGTGESHTIREFLQEAFGYMDLDWHPLQNTSKLSFPKIILCSVNQ